MSLSHKQLQVQVAAFYDFYNFHVLTMSMTAHIMVSGFTCQSTLLFMLLTHVAQTLHAFIARNNLFFLFFLSSNFAITYFQRKRPWNTQVRSKTFVQEKTLSYPVNIVSSCNVFGRFRFLLLLLPSTSKLTTKCIKLLVLPTQRSSGVFSFLVESI